jgi:hypothetical protein
MNSKGMILPECVAMNSVKQRPNLVINSNLELNLLLSWEGGAEKIQIKPGVNEI